MLMGSLRQKRCRSSSDPLESNRINIGGVFKQIRRCTLDVFTVEAEFSAQPCVSLQALAGGQGRAHRLFQAILIAAL